MWRQQPKRFLFQHLFQSWPLVMWFWNCFYSWNVRMGGCQVTSRCSNRNKTSACSWDVCQHVNPMCSTLTVILYMYSHQKSETVYRQQRSERKQNHKESQGNLMVSGFIEHFIIFAFGYGRDRSGNGKCFFKCVFAVLWNNCLHARQSFFKNAFAFVADAMHF